MEKESIKTENTAEKQNEDKRKNMPHLFKPGESGNPNGRPKGAKNFTTKIRDALSKIAEGKDYTYEEAFVKAILKKAIIDQDTAVMKLMWNYLDGMPTQNIDMDVNRDEPDIREIYKELKQKANDDDKTKTSEADTKPGKPS